MIEILNKKISEKDYTYYNLIFFIMKSIILSVIIFFPQKYLKYSVDMKFTKKDLQDSYNNIRNSLNISNNYFLYKIVYLFIILSYHFENILLNTGFKHNLNYKNKKKIYRRFAHHFVTIFYMFLSYYRNAFLYGFYTLLCVTLSDIFAGISTCFSYENNIYKKSLFYVIYIIAWFFFRNILFLYLSYHMISHLLNNSKFVTTNTFITNILLIVCNLLILSFNMYSSYKHYEKINILKNKYNKKIYNLNDLINLIYINNQS